MTMMTFIGMCPLEKYIQDEIAPAVAWVKIANEISELINSM